ncbi:EamA family transporter [Candidatus Woesearchaeota archaeon]|nr:EamA family transporter [Candidatus Woesearchaeota archaeon]
MTDWFILSVMAMIFYGIQNFLFKFASQHGYDSVRVNSISTLTIVASSGILFLVSEPSVSGPYFLLLVIGNGITYLFANVCRIESFKLSPSRLANPIASMYIALTPILAFFIFRERITILQLLGLTTATFTIIILAKKQSKEKKKGIAMLGIIFAGIAAASTSFNNIIGKSAAITGDIASFMFFSYLFSFFISLAMQTALDKKENPIRALVKDHRATRLGLVSGLTGFAAYYLMLRSLVSGPAMLIFPIIGLGVVLTEIISTWDAGGKLTTRSIAAIAASAISIILLR